MRLKYILFIGFLLLMIWLSYTEYQYQLLNIIPRNGRILITLRLAVIIHLILYIGITGLVYLILKISKTRSELRNRILLLGISLSTALLLSEIVVRFAGIVSVYSERRGGYYLSLFQQPVNGNPYHTHPANNLFHLRSAEFDYVRQTNSLGLRFAEVPLHKDSNEIRIMALGDSFTDGDGAPQDSAWMNSLEFELRNRYPDKNFTFINAGVCGSDVVSEYKLYKDKLQNYMPDILLVATNISDIDDISLRGGFERFVSEDFCRYKQGPWWESIYAASHLCRLAFWRNTNNLLITDGEYKKEALKSQGIINKTLNAFQQLTEKTGCKFVAVIMPVAVDFYEKDFFSLYPLTDSLKHEPYTLNTYNCYLDKHGVNKENIFDYYWKVDGHHNSRGYQIFGQCVADYFVDKKLIENLQKK